ncbi:MAG: LacI family DNA-binding transcriptional regulator [Deinococcales bacterium]
MATIKEVSQQAKVSPATVSRVLNGTAPVNALTRQRVLKAVKELAYQPNPLARALVTKRSGGVGVVVNELSSPFCGGILWGIESVLEPAGMHLMVSSGHSSTQNEKAAIHFLKNRHCDALIVQIEACNEDELLAVIGNNIPTVIMGRHIPEMSDRCVYLDNEKGAYLATQFLIQQGHHHIAHISGPLALQDSRNRLDGYKRALQEAKMDYNPHYVLEGTFQEVSGYSSVKRLLARQLPLSAIFMGNDQMALGALKALYEHKLSVPQDISLIAYDDILAARYSYPPLSTIRQPLEAMGKSAAEVILHLLDKESLALKEVQKVFEPELVIRESVMNLC